MKLFYFFAILLLLNNCSFDNKTGIWKNENNIGKSENVIFKDFKEVVTSDSTFEKEIILNKNLKIFLSKPEVNVDWKDYFFNYNNNSINYKYNNSNEIILKSKRLSRHNVNKNILLENKNLLLNDENGNIIVFSTLSNQVISKFNFYKKRFKKIKKLLNLIVENNIIYTTDNLGYVYAYNYKINKIIWAKNYKTPFRSNLKIIKDKIIAADEKNNLVFFNKKNGNIIKKIPTEETLINNQFRNNISSNNEDKLFFLNSYGTLYSIDLNSININWFINLNFSSNINPNNLFSGVEIVNYKNNIIVSSLNKTYIIDTQSGLIKKKFNFASITKPIANNDLVYFLSKNNLLILVDLKNNEILFSYNINKKIAETLNSKERNVELKTFILANNNIKIFLMNSFIVDFYKNGELSRIYKLPKKIYSQPIIINGSVLYIDKKNRLIVLN